MACKCEKCRDEFHPPMQALWTIFEGISTKMKVITNALTFALRAFILSVGKEERERRTREA